MSPRLPNSCPHEHRHAVTVCLHCRHAEIAAIRARRRALLSKIGLAVAGVGAFAAMGFAGAGALEGSPSGAKARWVAPGTPPQATRPAPAVVEQPVTVQAAGSVTAPAATTAPAAPAAAPAVASVAAVAPPPPPTASAERTELGEGVYAVRAADTVTVHFDTPMVRTRRPEKFERTVRTTLPALYGATSPAAVHLASLPEGEIARSGDLLTELPARGISLMLPDGRTLTLWPQTRPGQDGPLVVSYRAVVR